MNTAFKEALSATAKAGRLARIQSARKLAETYQVRDAEWWLRVAVSSNPLALAAAGCCIPQNHKIAARALMDYRNCCRKIGDDFRALHALAALIKVIMDKQEKRHEQG